MENKIRTHIENTSVQWEEAGEGIRRKILGYDQDLMMVVVEFKKGSIGQEHKHPHRQVTYIIEGSFEVLVGNERKVLKSGDGFFVPPDVVHGVIALENSLLTDVFSPYRADFLKKD
jgi:quercetin dioxygenase-like cupin family protein